MGIPKSEQSLLSHQYSPRFIYAMQHLPFRELIKHVPRRTWEEFSKVTVVRNPWDRIVSDWKWRQGGGLPLGDLSFPDFVRHVEKLLSPGKEWDRQISRQEFSSNYLGHFLPQVEYAGPPDSGVRVLRFERLASDWRKYCQNDLRKAIDLPHMNTSSREGRHYSVEYKGHEDLIEVVGRLYQEDAERFEYRFEEAPKKKGFGDLLKGLSKTNKSGKGSKSAKDSKNSKGDVREAAQSSAGSVVSGANATSKETSSAPGTGLGSDATESQSRKRPRVEEVPPCEGGSASAEDMGGVEGGWQAQATYTVTNSESIARSKVQKTSPDDAEASAAASGLAEQQKEEGQQTSSTHAEAYEQGQGPDMSPSSHHTKGEQGHGAMQQEAT